MGISWPRLIDLAPVRCRSARLKRVRAEAFSLMFSAIRMTLPSLRINQALPERIRVSITRAKALRPIRFPDSVSGISILPVRVAPRTCTPSQETRDPTSKAGNRDGSRSSTLARIERRKAGLRIARSDCMRVRSASVRLRLLSRIPRPTALWIASRRDRVQAANSRLSSRPEVVREILSMVR